MGRFTGKMNEISKIRLVEPSFDESDIAAVSRVMKEGKVGEGEIVKKFEREMASYIGVRSGIATSSGTAALYLAMRALGIQKGDEVILPTYTCLTLLNAVIHTGAKPILVDNNYDVEHMDFNINQEKVFESINGKTKAIIIPYMFGTPTNINKLKKTGIKIIEDCALSLGAEIDDKKISSFGDVSILSFNSKMISTGKGGMLLSNSKELLSEVDDLTNYESKIVSLRSEPNKEKITLNYDLGYEMSDIQAAIGLNQLRKLPEFIKTRRRLAKRYSKEFSGKDFIIPKMEKTTKSIFFRYMVKANKNILEVIKEGIKNNIEFGRGVYPPIHYCYQKERKEFPNAEKAINSMISIPLYPSLSEEQIKKIIIVSKKIL